MVGVYPSVDKLDNTRKIQRKIDDNFMWYGFGIL